jgi:predicted DNA-binding transcriptional regulator AlpA
MSQAPTLLNIKQACAELGVSERKFHQLRAEPWFPAPVVLGPRCSKFVRDELIQAARNLAPRGAAQAEPAWLAAARAERKAA